jgi:hypothetical protein
MTVPDPPREMGEPDGLVLQADVPIKLRPTIKSEEVRSVMRFASISKEEEASSPENGYGRIFEA